MEPLEDVAITSGPISMLGINVIPCTGIADPAETALVKRGNGLDPVIQDYVKNDRDYGTIVELVDIYIARGVREFNFGCMGGVFRSVAVAELIFERLSGLGFVCHVEHKGL